jgi:hypothetical protein
VLLGPVASLALLVVVAGVAKLRSPEPTERALRALGVTAASAAPARVLGVSELVLGVWALLAGSAPACAALALLHLGFAMVTARLRRMPSVPCGCLGSSEAPATTVGLVLNLACAVVAAAAVALPPGPVGNAVADAPLTAAVTVVVAATGAWLLYELHGGLPSARAVVR